MQRCSLTRTALQLGRLQVITTSGVAHNEHGLRQVSPSASTLGSSSSYMPSLHAAAQRTLTSVQFIDP